MNLNTCIFCGEIIPEGIQVCPMCEHRFSQPESYATKTPTDKQICLVDAIAETLMIDFPQSSHDFTSAAYWKFIHDHIDEAKAIWRDDNVGDDFLYDMDWFSPINQ